MITSLSEPSWINPQIDFLLFLQNIRLNCPVFIDKIFLSITIFGELWLPTLICAIVYWCIDFKAGIYLFSLEGFNSIICHFFKMIACVYRPWILSDKIQPSKLAVPFAKGYSFPSGHSSMSSSVLGGSAFLLRRKKIICISLIALVLCVGFSRLWLGVHTPQDVSCGLLTGLCLVFILNKLVDWAEKNPNRYIILTVLVNVITLLLIVFICYFNHYRMDYVSGKLLVDPVNAIRVTIVNFGYMLGLINGCYICARFFRFDPKEISIKNRVIIGLIGALLIIFMLKYIAMYLFGAGLPMKLTFIAMFFVGIIITLIYPMIFQFFTKKSE